MQSCDFCDAPNPLHNENRIPDDWAIVIRGKGITCYACHDCAPKFADKNAAPTRHRDDDDDFVAPQSLDMSSKERLKLYISKIENLVGERTDLNEAIREIYNDAKALGFDTKAMRKVITRRAKDTRAVLEEEAMLDLYLHALGEI